MLQSKTSPLLLWLVFPRCLTLSSSLADEALWLQFKSQAWAAPVFILIIYTLWWLMDSYVLGFIATTSNQGPDPAFMELVVNASQFQHWQEAPDDSTVSQSKQANIKEQFGLKTGKKCLKSYLLGSLLHSTPCHWHCRMLFLVVFSLLKYGTVRILYSIPKPSCSGCKVKSTPCCASLHGQFMAPLLPRGSTQTHGWGLGSRLHPTVTNSLSTKCYF